MSPTVVLDAPALLAWLRDEPGAETVDPATAVMSAVNWSETAQKITQRGGDAERTLARLAALGVTVEPLTAPDAVAAGTLWASTHSAGLSLGDQACLTLARRLGLPVATTDQAWSKLTDLGIEVQVLRRPN